MEATVEAVVEVEKGAATKLRGDDATGATGANASVEVANRQIAERMATILFMVIVVLREDDTLVGKVMVWATTITILIWMLELGACRLAPSSSSIVVVERIREIRGRASRHFAPLVFPPFRATFHIFRRFDDRRSTIDTFWPLAMHGDDEQIFH